MNTKNIPSSEWADGLSAFTQRNAGRITVLEEHDRAIGAQEEEHGYPLRGVGYDRRDGRVEVMLGDLTGTERHLTRSIAAVTSLDRMLDANGRDFALRIAHDGGQTLLRFDD
jgi:hypothetical protein